MIKNKLLWFSLSLIFLVTVLFILENMNVLRLSSFSGSSQQKNSSEAFKESASFANKDSYSSAKARSSNDDMHEASSNLQNSPGSKLVTSKVENKFASAYELNFGTIQQAITSDNFDRIIDRIYSESIADPDAVVLTNAYEKNMKQSLQHSKAGISLNKIACGIKVCAAIIDGDNASDANFEAWLAASESNKTIPMYSVGSYSVHNSDGTYSHRIVFSNDPQTNGVVIPTGAAKP